MSGFVQCLNERGGWLSYLHTHEAKANVKFEKPSSVACFLNPFSRLELRTNSSPYCPSFPGSQPKLGKVRKALEERFRAKGIEEQKVEDAFLPLCDLKITSEKVTSPVRTMRVNLP